MDIPVDRHSFFVFDLDDTLFLEVDYLKSAYREIASTLAPSNGVDLYDEMWARYQRRENVFEWIVATHRGEHSELTVETLLRQYREHTPTLALDVATAAFLDRTRELGVPAGIITDGRSVTQRNKLKALGLESYFRDVIVSEEFGSAKPDERNFRFFEDRYPGKSFCFFGDNLRKDFIVPIRLGWTVVCLKDSGQNVHSQDWSSAKFPGAVVSSFSEISLSRRDESAGETFRVLPLGGD